MEGLILLLYIFIARLFTSKEDLRRMEAEEIQEIRRDGNAPR